MNPKANIQRDAAMRAARRQRLRRWLILFGLWTLAGVTYAGAQYISLMEASRQASSPRPLPAVLPFVVWSLTTFYIWAALSPFIALFARRFPVEGARRWRNLSLHIPAAAFFILLEIIIWSTLRWMIFIPPLANVQSFSQLFWMIVTSWMIIGLMIYVITLIVIYALKYHGEFAAEQLKLSEMRAQLAAVELQALKTQLHPHFLFNTLNAVAELVYDKPAIADRLIAQLSDLLRFALKSSRADEVSLKEELDFLNKYIEIQETLLQERLTVRLEVDASVLDAAVPNIVLQPLVENAIRHGIAPRARGGTIEIRAARDNGNLQLRVRDDGIGLSPNATERVGIGLSNMRARLRNLYGAAHRFELSESPGGGVTVEMTIPFRESVEESGE